MSVPDTLAVHVCTGMEDESLALFHPGSRLVLAILAPGRVHRHGHFRDSGIVLFIIGIFGPAVSGILLTCLTGDQQERREYWRRLTSFTRIRPGWYAIIILIAPVCSVLAILTGLVIKGSLPSFDTAVGYLTRPLAIIPFAIVTMIYGPLPEELGWRGYALDRLQRKWNAFVSSLVLGVIWAVWHLPIFMRRSLLSGVVPLWSTQFWVSMGPGILATAVIMTWIYNNTQRSILAAILFHFMVNFTLEFLVCPETSRSIYSCG